jgi:hypothetical protein
MKTGRPDGLDLMEPTLSGAKWLFREAGAVSLDR